MIPFFEKHGGNNAQCFEYKPGTEEHLEIDLNCSYNGDQRSVYDQAGVGGSSFMADFPCPYCAVRGGQMALPCIYRCLDCVRDYPSIPGIADRVCRHMDFVESAKQQEISSKIEAEIITWRDLVVSLPKSGSLVSERVQWVLEELQDSDGNRYLLKDINSKKLVDDVIGKWKLTFNLTMEEVLGIEDTHKQNLVVDEMLRVRKCSPGSLSYRTILEGAELVSCGPGEGLLSESLATKLFALEFALYSGQQVEFIMRRKEGDGFIYTLKKLEIAAICLLHCEMRIGSNLITKYQQKVMDRYGLIEGTKRVQNFNKSVNLMLQGDKEFAAMHCGDEKETNFGTRQELTDYLETKNYTSSWGSNITGQKVDTIKVSCARQVKIVAPEFINDAIESSFMPCPGFDQNEDEEIIASFKHIFSQFRSCMKRLSHRG
jgi:hypothetical protein